MCIITGLHVDRERAERVPKPAELPAPDQVLQEGALDQDHGRRPECRPGQSEPVAGRGQGANLTRTRVPRTILQLPPHSNHDLAYR